MIIVVLHFSVDVTYVCFINFKYKLWGKTNLILFLNNVFCKVLYVSMVLICVKSMPNKNV